MNHPRDKALILRLKGYSYNEINRLLDVPKSTLSGWFRDLVLPIEAQERIKGRVSQGVLNGLVRRNKMQTPLAQERARRIRQESQKEITVLSQKDLCIIGVALYWAEGYKRVAKVRGREVTHHPISFANSDPFMVKTFVEFLIRVVGVEKDKIRLNLRLFKHIEEHQAISYWSKVTALARNNFDKVSYVLSRSSMGKRPFNRLPYGTVAVRVSDTKQFHRLMGWIEGTEKALAHLFQNS